MSRHPVGIAMEAVYDAAEKFIESWEYEDIPEDVAVTRQVDAFIVLQDAVEKAHIVMMAEQN
jgi:hypothetical protein